MNASGSRRRTISILLNSLLALSCWSGRATGAQPPGTEAWVTRGLEGFLRGTLGNAGQNLYVSRAGILQRIHQFDLNHDGYLDALFCNSQEHWEKPPAYVYSTVLGNVKKAELPSDGAVSGALADFDRDGYQDLVLAMAENGITSDLNAFLYFGGPEGMSERYRLELPAPSAASVASGDFNGDGSMDLAFVSGGKLRIFYQGELGFENKRFVDLEVEADQVDAADLDRDGHADLYVLKKSDVPAILWGGRDGISILRHSPLPANAVPGASGKPDGTKDPAWRKDATPLARILRLDAGPALLVSGESGTTLLPVARDRGFGEPLKIGCPRVVSAAVGDINGDRRLDLVLVSRGSGPQGNEHSSIYWGNGNGFDLRTPAVRTTTNACDVAVEDFNGDGFADVAICQDHSPESYTFHSPVYAGNPRGLSPEPVLLETLDAKRVLAGKTSAGKTPDLVFVNRAARGSAGRLGAVVYYGGAGGFSTGSQARLPGFGAVASVCADFNDDGRVDVALANCAENAVQQDPGSFVYYGNPEGFPAQPSLSLPTARAHGVACADLNRDGYLDLSFVGFYNSDIVTYFGGEKGFSPSRSVRLPMKIGSTVYDDPRWNYLADLNRDGWLDMVLPQISFDRSFVLWGGSGGFAMERRRMLSVWHGSFAQAADLNGDGWPELVIGGHQRSSTGPPDSFLYIYWNGPDGLREERRTQLPASAVNAIGIADFNNDGILDIFICNYHDGRERDIDSHLYWGRAGGMFSASDRTPFRAHSASGCIPADFNEDGYVDLAIAYHKVRGDHVAYSEVWWNGPRGFSKSRVTRLPSSGPHGMIVVNPGNQLDRGPEEYYVSAPFELPEGTGALKVRWQAEVPAKTWVRAQVRAAAGAGDLEHSTWRGREDGSWLENGDPIAVSSGPGRWIQYRLALGAKGSGQTPRVSEVAVTYGP